MELVMNCVVKFRQYQNYIWVYIIGAILVLINGIFLQNMDLANFSSVILYCILFYKSIHILICYKKTESYAYQSIDKKEFQEKYSVFRIKVLAFWLAFVGLCVIGKFVLQISHWYFYSCTYFFLLLDRLFINVGCLLRKFSDPKGEAVLCCCGCPCRGWDLLMIHTPLLFALNHQIMYENILIVLSSALAVISMVCWERAKYSLVEVRRKCAHPCNLTLCRENKRTYS